MQKITPHLWYDKEAKEAAELYTRIIPDSKVIDTTVLPGTPGGDTEIVTFNLGDMDFMSISAGPLFKFTPAISFTLVSKSLEELDKMWAALSEGGMVMMEYTEYPFAKKYGWCADKYGLTWQVVYDDGHFPYKKAITPSFLFTQAVAGKSEEAFTFYASVFPDSKMGDMARYPAGMPDEGRVMHGAATLAGQDFFFMDSGMKEHQFTFNEAVSLMVSCEDQKEIDYYWEKLSAVPESEQCGWLKDKYGVSWQIVPSSIDKMMSEGTPEQVARLTEAFLKMKKFDIATLERAYNGD